MAMLSDVDDEWFLPTKQKEARPCSSCHRHAEPHVVRHEDQHEEVAHHDLNQMQQGLDQVVHSEHPPSNSVKTMFQSFTN